MIAAYERPCRCNPNPFQCGAGCTCIGCGCLKEGPILFTGENVVRIFNGLKWQTRRMLTARGKAQREWLTPELLKSAKSARYCPPTEQHPAGVQLEHPRGGALGFIASPYGGVGDRLWVRETWAVGKGYDADASQKLARAKISDLHMGLKTWYRADDSRAFAWHNEGTQFLPVPDSAKWPHPKARGQWRPSIFMPRWASRLQLEVTRVRVERLEEITEADAVAEGVESVDAYRRLWNEINGGDRLKEWITRGEDNETVSAPWVWCVDFKRVEVTCG